MISYFSEILEGLNISFFIASSSLLIALILSLFLSVILLLKMPILDMMVRLYLYLFTGTPLLIQIFLIYYGPGQFPGIQSIPWLWGIFEKPWLCMIIALSLNSTAYTTQLICGSISTLPSSQIQSCLALGMSQRNTLQILLPLALRRALSSYSNEVILVFKSTSLAYTITIMDIMGHSRFIYGQTYDTLVFTTAGIIYLVINAILTFIMRWLEYHALAFERKS
jgi:arginine transport system permease protein